MGTRGTPEKAVEIGGHPGKPDRAVTGRAQSAEWEPLGDNGD